MAYFLIIEYQTGGCDYTIGCGVRVNDIIEAQTIDSAIEKFVSNVEHEYREEDGVLTGNPWEGDYTPNLIEVYELTGKHSEIDVKVFAARAQNEIDNKELLKVEAAERAEFERLAKKYGK